MLCEGPPVQQPGWAVVFHYEVVKDDYWVKLLIYRLGKPNIAKVFTIASKLN